MTSKTNSVAQLLYTPPTDVYARLGEQKFVGRQWLIEHMDSFLNNAAFRCGVFDLVASAGLGKTAFLAHLVKTRNYLHLFGEQFNKTVAVVEARLSLAAQLVNRYNISEYADAATLKDAAQNDSGLLGTLLGLASQRLRAGQKIIIVCDALDEACRDGYGQAFGLPAKLPQGVYLILSRRPESVPPDYQSMLTPKNSLGHYTRYEMKGDEPHQLEDLRAYLHEAAQSPALAPTLAANGYDAHRFTDVLLTKCEGMWMHARAMLDDLTQDPTLIKNLDQLPQGLVAYYAERFLRLHKNESQWQQMQLPFLTTLAAVAEPARLSTLLAWSGIRAQKQQAIEQLIHTDWSGYISHNTKDDTYQFNHATLREFFSGNVARLSFAPIAKSVANLLAELRTQHQKSHQRIIKSLRTACKNNWAGLGVQDGYTRQHLITHLLQAGDADSLREARNRVIYDDAWAKARAHVDQDYGGYLGDLLLIWRHAEQDEAWDIQIQIRCAAIQSSIFSLAGKIPARLLRQLVEVGEWTATRALETALRKPEAQDRAEALVALTPVIAPIPSLLQRLLQAAFDMVETDAQAAALCGLALQLGLVHQRKILARILSHKDKDKLMLVASLFLISAAPELQQEIFDSLHVIKQTQERLAVLVMYLKLVSGKLRERLIHEVMQTIPRLRDRHDRNQAILDCLDALPPKQRKQKATELFNSVLAATKRGKVSYQDAGTLVKSIRWLPRPLQTKAFEYVTTQITPSSKNHMLANLSGEALPKRFHPIVLQLIRGIEGAKTRSHALAAALKSMPDTEKRSLAIELADLLPALDDDNVKLQLLSEVIPHLPQPLQSACAAQAWQAFTNLLTISEKNGAYSFFENRLRLLYPYVPAHQQTQIVSQLCKTAHSPHNSLLGELTEKAFSSLDEDAVSRTYLQTLAPQISDADKRKLLRMIQAVPSESRRAAAIDTLASHLPTTDIPAAIRMVQAFKQDDLRAQSLSLLADIVQGKRKRQVIRNALQAASAIHDESELATVVAKLSSHVSQPQKNHAIQWVLQQLDYGSTDESDQSNLATIAEAIPPKFHNPLVAFAMRETHDERRARLLIGLLPHLVGSLRKQVAAAAFVLAQTIQQPKKFGGLLSDLMPFAHRQLSTQIVSKLMTQAIELNEPFVPANHLMKASLYASPTDQDRLMQCVFTLAKNNADKHTKSRGYDAPYLADDELTAPLKEKYAASWFALSVAHNKRSHHLEESASLVPFLSAHHRQQLINDLWGREQHVKESIRVRLATALYPYVSRQTQTSILALIRHIKSNSAKTNAMIELLPLMPAHQQRSFAQEIFSLLPHVRDRDTRVGAISQIIPHLQGHTQQQAIENLFAFIPILLHADAFEEVSVAEMWCAFLECLPEASQALVLRNLRDSDEHVKVANGLSEESTRKALPDALKGTAFAEILRRAGYAAVWQYGPHLRQIISEWQRLKWSGLEQPNSQWSALLHAGASVNRESLLSELADILPLILHLGVNKSSASNKDSLVNAMIACVQDVHRWWP